MGQEVEGVPGAALWQVSQDVSPSGTLKPDMEDSECQVEWIKSWPRGGYVRGRCPLWAGLSCGGRQARQSELTHSQGIPTLLGPDASSWLGGAVRASLASRKHSKARQPLG